MKDKGLFRSNDQDNKNLANKLAYTFTDDEAKRFSDHLTQLNEHLKIIGTLKGGIPVTEKPTEEINGRKVITTTTDKR